MKKVKYTPEIREKAVQLVLESEKDYPSNWAAITAIAPRSVVLLRHCEFGMAFYKPSLRRLFSNIISK